MPPFKLNSRHRRVALYGMSSLLLLLLLLLAAAFYLFKNQGLSDGHWQQLSWAQVTVDGDGVPSIHAKDWPTLIEAQGYFAASERLWQMDLMRRKAGGRLAELFGPAAATVDIEAAQEQRLQVVDRAYELLPRMQKDICDRYAQGVNRFVEDHPWRWGIEYYLMFARPAAWHCRDSILVLLAMVDSLTATSSFELKRYVWHQHLSQQWWDFIFPKDHPWNEPLFDRERLSPGQRGPQLPPPDQSLPRQRLADLALWVDGLDSKVEDAAAPGSNSWAWRGQAGHFLFNDPHLGQSVPQLWIPLRLHHSEEDWVVGVALPGFPGIVLGMNPHMAWSFTNTGEDIDDLLIETLSADGKKYRGADGTWKAIEMRELSVPVKGQEPMQLSRPFTERGFLRSEGGMRCTRQWLALRPEYLKIPSLDMMRAKSWTAFNRAADDMTLPAQNIIVMDRQGGMGYRVSGTGLIRRQDGLIPRLVSDGLWQGVTPSSSRRRLWFPPGDSRRFLATANERIWLGVHAEEWFGDDRKDRIKSLLTNRQEWTFSELGGLQRDVVSRFRLELLQWLARHASVQDAESRERLQRWRDWDGSSRSDPEAFLCAGLAERRLSQLLIGALRRAYLPAKVAAAKYRASMKRAWLLKVIHDPEALARFGVLVTELAPHLVQHCEDYFRKNPRDRDRQHQFVNRWRAQHPFVGRLPVLGDRFAVKERPQFGAGGVLRAELPRYGPSMRLLWNLSDPERSRWAFPVGSSGHAGKPQYRNFAERWHQGETWPVFNSSDDLDFGFAGH